MPDAYPDDYQPDPWLDLADDIRRTARTAEQAEAWQARAEKAEARVAELEAAIERALTFFAEDRPRAAGTSLRAVLALGLVKGADHA